MAKSMLVELPNGKKILFGGRNDGGLQEVGVAGSIVQASTKQFEGALSSLRDLVELLDKNIENLAKRPSKIELEFGASLSGTCDLWVVSGEGKAEFKIKLTW